MSDAAPALPTSTPYEIFALVEDSESNVDARSTGAASNRRGGGALFKNPAIVGGASAAVALLLGVIIGRASVANTHRDDTLVRAEGHLAQRPDKGEEPEDEAPEPTTEF